MIEKEIKLSLNVWCKIIILSVNWTWPENCHIWKCFFNKLLSESFSLKIQRLWINVSSCSWKMNKPMNSMFFAGVRNSFRNLHVDKLIILSVFNFFSWTKQIYYHIWVLYHSLNHLLIFVVHVPLGPRFIYFISVITDRTSNF